MDSLLAIGSSSTTNHNLPPPPSFSRLPPDGHEFPFPPNYQETGPIPLILDGDSSTNMKLICSSEVVTPIKPNAYFNGAKTDENSTSPPRNFNFSNSTNNDGFKTKNAGSASWRNDEKSEKSVRDKIAMFSNRPSEQITASNCGTEERNLKKMNRFKSSENVSSQNDFVDCASFGSSASRSLSRSYMNVTKVGNLVDRPMCQPLSRNGLRRSPELIETSNANSARNFILNSKLHSELDFGARSQNVVDLTLSSSSSAYSSCSPESSLSPTSSPSYVIGSSCTLPRKTDDNYLDNGISTMTRATSFSGGMRPHNRSQSLVDVGNLQNRYSGEKSFSNSDTANRQASLNNLIEQRRRSMSKLRGLVIPEKVSEIANVNQTILDLPEIKTEIKINCHDDKNRNSKSNGVNYPLKNRFNSLTNQQNSNYKRNSGSNNFSKDSSHLVNLYSPQTKENLGSGRSWKSQLPTNEIPKYSPAFKRKSLTVCSKPSSNSDIYQTKSCTNSNHNINSSVSLSRRLPQSLNPRPYSCLNGALSNNITMIDKTNTSLEYTKFESKTNGYLISANNAKSKLDYGETVRDHTGGGDSDSDSAVSSSRSSISPPMSPMPEPNCHHLNEADDPSRHIVPSLSLNDQKSLHRTLSSDTTASAASSTTSTLTSGSQASSSSSSSNSSSSNGDSKSKRVLKPKSVEAINRKNVLSSAKYSCGLDAKIGSPLIQRKFVEDPANANGRNPVDSSHDGNDFAADLAFLNYLEKTVCPAKNKSNEKPETGVGSEPVYHQLAEGVAPGDENVQVAFIEITENSPPVNGISDQPTAESDFESEQSGSQSNSLTLESQSGSLADIDSPRGSDRVDMNGNCESKSPFIFRPKSGRDFEDSLNENDSDSSCPLIKKLSKEFNLPVNDTEHSDSDRSKANRTLKLHNTRPGDLSPEPSYKSDLSNVEESPPRNKFLGQDRKDGSIKSVVSPRSINAHRSVSVNDIRKAFEKPEPVAVTPSNRNSLTKLAHHARVSSLDSTASDDSLLPPYGSVSNLHREQFGSISSLASSTSLISQQELQQLIDDANQTAEEAGGEGSGHEVAVIVLHRDVPGASIGITLAGGADYETKEITVHKVLAGSPADRDGRIQKGDRILSINGRSMKDATHREALSILKAPRFEVVLVVSHWRHKNGDVTVSNVEAESISRTVQPSRPFRKLIEDNVEHKIPESESIKYGPPVTVSLIKDGAGLGFSLEGGKDSPLGDQALTVKKIFSGGCAEKCGQLSIGDELLKVNETDVTIMTRIEAWSLMKRLENGKVTLTVRHVIENKN